MVLHTGVRSVGRYGQAALSIDTAQVQDRGPGDIRVGMHLRASQGIARDACQRAGQFLICLVMDLDGKKGGGAVRSLALSGRQGLKAVSRT